MQSRSPLRASLNRRREGGAHPGSLPGELGTDLGRSAFPGQHSSCGPSLDAAGRRAQTRSRRRRHARRGRASPAGFRSPPLGAALRLLPGSSEKEGGGRVS